MATQTGVSTLLLRNVPLFTMLPENQLAVLAGVVNRRSFPRGSTIIAAGDVTDSLYVVISGTLKVTMSDDAGHEIILSMLGPREYFWEMVSRMMKHLQVGGYIDVRGKSIYLHDNIVDID